MKYLILRITRYMDIAMLKKGVDLLQYYFGTPQAIASGELNKTSAKPLKHLLIQVLMLPPIKRQ
ncbi:hypothetical protein BJV82DRAFT_599755 [Fennellomyces sp. T-0311]|nr:hypothetical protein BJV82DRAFT_599755 [Fennellomyces sp. T-0311]